MTEVATARGKPLKALLIVAAASIGIGLILWFTLTSSASLIPEPAAPTAQQVRAGRDAYHQLRTAKGNKGGIYISFGPRELDGLGIIASHGFRPDRLRLSIVREQFRVEGSHQMPFHRWLNVTARAEAPSANFPRAHVKVGLVNLPPFMSRWAFELARWLLERNRCRLPPLDEMVRKFSIKHGRIVALVSLPPKSGLIDQMAGVVARQEIDGAVAARIYCSLAEAQQKTPSSDFAEHVRRAISLPTAGAKQSDFNRSAFVALGMLLVDERVGDFAETARDQIRNCRIPQVHASIYGRRDWTAHWVLSAAIAVGAGVQLSEAAGEWKELADSLPDHSQISPRDPSGFSMADLAADRAGFSAARAAVDPTKADLMARKLARATPEQLLPKELVQREDGLTNAQFVNRYGGVDDPRFRARLNQIDAMLAKTGLR